MPCVGNLALHVELCWRCEYNRSEFCRCRAGRYQSASRGIAHLHTDMSSFSESALEKKLVELSSSQQSVQTLSLWIIHHRKHSALIVKVWHRELKKGNVVYSFLSLVNNEEAFSMLEIGGITYNSGQWRLWEEEKYVYFSLSCSKDQQKADLLVSSQWCNPEQQEERTRVRQRLWVCPCWCLLTCCKVSVWVVKWVFFFFFNIYIYILLIFMVFF